MNLPDISTRNNATLANGAGELGRVGASAAFTNAAAGAAGTRAVDMPATLERPWRAVGTK